MGGAGGGEGRLAARGRERGGRTPGAPGARSKDPGGPPKPEELALAGSWKGNLGNPPATWRARARRADQHRGQRPGRQAGIRWAPLPTPWHRNHRQCPHWPRRSWVGGELTRGQEAYLVPSGQQSCPRPLTSCMTLGASHHSLGPG